jgi:RNA polymerase sigma factor (sigma-70 family)
MNTMTSEEAVKHTTLYPCAICDTTLPTMDDGRPNFHHYRSGKIGEVCRGCVQQLATDNLGLVPHTVNGLWKLWWVKRRYKGNRELADSDAAHGLMKAAWTYRPSTGYAFTTLAVSVIKNQLLHDRRKLQDKFNESFSYPAEWWEPATSWPEEFEQDKERDANVEHLLSMLDQRSAKVMRLYYFDNLTLKEIGARIGVSKTRANQIQTAARKRLYDLFSSQNRKLPCPHTMVSA